MNRIFLSLALGIAFTATSFSEPAQAGWIDLTDLSHWTKEDNTPLKSGRWVLEDGVLHLQKRGGGNIYTTGEYGDFELSLEWKISPKGNSGIKYRVTKYGKRLLGPEYQVLDDDTHPDGKNGANRHSAALYYLKPADPKTKKLKPVGEWNSTRIVVKGGHIQHYLNGAKVVDITVGSDAWKAAMAKSKFKNIKGFAENPKGKIMLQDHSDPVWYRKIRIRKL